MEFVALNKSVRVSPRKIRLVADSIRNKTAAEALQMLELIRKRASYPLEKTLKSAIANATHNAKAVKEELLIKKIEVTEGPAFKRFHPSTRGRTHPYKKRTSHIRIVLEVKE